MTAPLLITNVRLLEPESGRRSEPSFIQIAGGRITATGPGQPEAAAGQNTSGGPGQVLDGAGATVMPGLIDAHVHLILGSVNEAEVSTWAPSYAAARGLAEAERMLRRGFTTVRDVGGADHGLARALAEGIAPGPRLIYGGKALTQTGGHGDLRAAGDDALPCCQDKPGFARIADGPDAVRAAARDEFRKGASHLKVLVSGGVASPHDEIGSIQYSEAELRAAVDEADNHNRYVTVHAYHARAISRALRAGVRCVEHGNLIDDAALGLLTEQDAFLVPTLVTYEQLARHGRELGLAEQSYRKIAEVRDAGLDALARASAAGTSLVYGSDLLGPMQTAQLEEFALRAQVQPAAEVIRSATSTAARLLRLDGEVGTLAPGAHADLLVLAGNPLADLGVLTSPEQHLRYVIKAGQVISVAG